MELGFCNLKKNLKKLYFVRFNCNFLTLFKRHQQNTLPIRNKRLNKTARRNEQYIRIKPNNPDEGCEAIIPEKEPGEREETLPCLPEQEREHRTGL